MLKVNLFLRLICFNLTYCYLFLRELNFTKMKRAYFAGISRFGQKYRMLKGTKFREYCQNTDLH